MSRELFLSMDEFDLYSEYIEGLPHIHLDLKAKWSISNYKKAMKYMYHIRQLFAEENEPYIYCTSKLTDKKLQKFHATMGFEPWMQLERDGVALFLISRQPTVRT